MKKIMSRIITSIDIGPVGPHLVLDQCTFHSWGQGAEGSKDHQSRDHVALLHGSYHFVEWLIGELDAAW